MSLCISTCWLCFGQLIQRKVSVCLLTAVIQFNVKSNIDKSRKKKTSQNNLSYQDTKFFIRNFLTDIFLEKKCCKNANRRSHYFHLMYSELDSSGSVTKLTTRVSLKRKFGETNLH